MADGDRQHDTDKDAEQMSDDDEKPSVRKRIGELLVLGVYLFANVWEFWNESHLLCLALALLGILGLLLYDGALSIRQVFIVMALSTGVAAVIFFAAPPISLQETEFHGWLVPADDPTPETACGEGSSAKGTMLVLLGKSAALYRGDGAEMTVLKIRGRPIIKMKRGAEGLLINADIFDRSGALVARVEDNEFHLVQSEVAYGKRPDRSTLIVYGKEGEQSLYVRFLNATTVQILGKFYREGAPPVDVTKDYVGVGGSHFFVGCMVFGGEAAGWVLR